MKYFALSAAAAFGFANAAPTNDICFGNGFTQFTEDEIAVHTQGNSTLRENYLVRSKNINDYGSNFVTIACRYAPWQRNDAPYAPYNQTAWDREDAKNYWDHKADRDAMKQWIAATGMNGKNGNWPAGAFGRFRCGNRKGANRGWNEIRPLMKCPNKNEVGAWVTKLARQPEEMKEQIREQERAEAEQVCEGQVFDITFVVDGSGSMTLKNYQSTADFVGHIIDTLDVASDKVNVRLVQFSSSTQIHQDLSGDTQAVAAGLEHLKNNYMSGSTLTDLALNTVTQEINNNSRQNVEQIVVVLNDGQSNNAADTRTSSVSLKATGATVFAIGVGANAPEAELRDVIASDPTDTFMKIDDFAKLEDYMAKITKNLCEA